MSRVGLSEEQLAVAERARDAAMIDLAVDHAERFEDAQVLTLNHLRGLVALGRALAPSKRAWVEGLLTRAGLMRDIGPVEDYAVRAYAAPAQAMDDFWRMGAKVTKPPSNRRRE